MKCIFLIITTIVQMTFQLTNNSIETIYGKNTQKENCTKNKILADCMNKPVKKNSTLSIKNYEK